MEINIKDLKAKSLEHVFNISEKRANEIFSVISKATYKGIRGEMNLGEIVKDIIAETNNLEEAVMAAMSLGRLSRM